MASVSKHPWLTALTLATLVLASGSAIAGFSDTFFADLGEHADTIVERCVELEECGRLQSLNIGPQYYKLLVWDRKISSDLLAEPAGNALLVDASTLDQLLHEFYLWPKDVPRIGRIDLKAMPGLAVAHNGLTIHVKPDEAHTPELDLGGYRVIQPDEFDVPGKAVFAELAGSIDTGGGRHPFGRDEPRIRIGANFGVQWGLWQLHSRGMLGNYEDSTDLDYLYVERPLLSRAMRLRFGYMPAIVDCNLCVSSDLIGLSLSSDSLGGLLYPARNTTFVDINIPSDVDQIEIVVNGRTVRRENAFPGSHSVAVTGLQDGPNAIDIFGIDSASGTRQILRSLSRAASLEAPAPGHAERTLQFGWTSADANSLFKRDLDVDTAFAQFHQVTGLGKGQQWDLAALATQEGGLVKAGISNRLGTGRTEAAVIGSFSKGVAGGGLGFQLSQKFQSFNVAARGDICFDCFDGRSMNLREGLTGRISGSLSTSWRRTSLSGTIGYEFLDRDLLNWRVSARRNAFGGHLELYAGNAWSLDSRDDVEFPGDGVEVGLRFSRTFGGERMRSIASELQVEQGRTFASTTYTDRPRDGNGFFGRAEVEAAYIPDAVNQNRSLSAQVGYENRRARAAVNVAKRGENTEVQADAATGFVWVDGEFVVDRSVTRGGIFADGLLPGSPVFVGDSRIQATNTLGQMKLTLPRATRPVHFELDEGFNANGAAASRTASILPIPGAYYGIGDKYRRVERSYRILVGQENTPIAAGTILRGEDGEIIGAAGNEGIVSISGRPGAILFQQPELICQAHFTGKEPGSDLPVLRSICKVPDKPALTSAF